MVSAGTYVPYFNQAQVNESGDTKKLELNPIFTVGTQIPMSGPHYFMPEFGYGLFFNTPDKTSKDIFYLGYNFTYVWRDYLLLRYGLANHWYRLKGQGGTKRLRNGGGSTNFPAPDKTVTTYYTTLNFGAETFIQGREKSIRFDLEIMSFRKFDNRAYNYLLTFNFYRF